MRRFATAFVILLQLGPLVGAGICVHAAQQAEPQCAMPMDGKGHETGHSQPAPAQDCGQMLVCAPAAPMVPVTIHLFGATLPAATDYTAPAALSAGDPVAPPQPPPIA